MSRGASSTMIVAGAILVTVSHGITWAAEPDQWVPFTVGATMTLGLVLFGWGVRQ